MLPRKPDANLRAATRGSPPPKAIFVNPGSGVDEIDLTLLEKMFAGFAITECESHELSDHVRGAVDYGATVVGVAGGDGSISTAAGLLRGTNVALLPIPAGTRNHFAHDLGLHNVEDAARAAVSGRTVRVDVASLNDNTFVNNASIGSYTGLVRRRERHQRRWRKSVANLVAAWEELRGGRRVVVRLDGESIRVWSVLVGNGVYGTGLFDLTQRASLQAGLLDVWLVRADRRLSRLRVAGALLLGRLDASLLVHRRTTAGLTIDVPSRIVGVALDGELKAIAPPLEFRAVPGALCVIA